MKPGAKRTTAALPVTGAATLPEGVRTDTVAAGPAQTREGHGRERSKRLPEAESLAGLIATLRLELHDAIEQLRKEMHQRLDRREAIAVTLSERLNALEKENNELRSRGAALRGIARFLPGSLKRGFVGAMIRPSSAPSRSTAEHYAEVIRTSGLLNTAAYWEKAGGGGTDEEAALHYVTEGERQGIAPSDRFDPVYYAERYPDVAAAGMCLLGHFILHGRAEGRRGIPVARDFTIDEAKHDVNKPTVLLVSHEASRTGAPVLALAIGRKLKEQYNIATILLRGGDLMEEFDVISTQLFAIEDSHRLPIEFKYLVKRVLEQGDVSYAIVSSIESKDIVSSLTLASIPSVSVIHEFSSYSRPLRAVRESLGWATELLFSTNATAESFRKEHAGLNQRQTHLLPQGLCSLQTPMEDEDREAEREKLRQAMRPAGSENALVVLGAGSVHIRKGIDLFLASAAAAIRLAGGDRPLRFVWIGHGYEPTDDMAYSVYLAEQIERSGLKDQVVILDQVEDLEPAYAMADIFFLSSRLDPLPNVTIEAAVRALPVLCFEGASGMAEILMRDATAGETVIPHLDTHLAAQRIVDLANSPALRKQIGEATRALATKAFDMDAYVKGIDAIGKLAGETMRRRNKDLATIAADDLFDAEIFLPRGAPPMPREQAIMRFLAFWSAARGAPHQLDNLDWRRPFAGFNPQIYAEHHPEVFTLDVNPLADFIRKGRPKGPWLHEVIKVGPGIPEPRDTPDADAKLRTAIQAHFHYPDQIGAFLDALAVNDTKCDLLLSTGDEEKASMLKEATADYSKGDVRIEIVPNRGRDIAPLLTAFGEALMRDYDIVGHLHSKRSSGIDEGMGEVWRDFLWQHLLGPRYPMIDLVLSSFAADGKLGLVFPEDPHLCDWDANREIAEELAAKAGIKTPLAKFFEFPVGTMFWARPRALSPLIELRLGWGDYPKEPLANDGTMLHALERLIPFAAAAEGYSFATLQVAGISR